MRCESRYLMCVAVAVGVLALSGCAREPQRRFLLLDVAREGPALTPALGTTLAVREFRVSPRFSRKKLIYRTGRFTYESDYYSEFLARVGPMIAEQTRRWLSAAGLFAGVVNLGSDVEPSHVLEGNVAGLYGDFRDKTRSKAVMELELFLVQTVGGEPKIAFSKAYSSSAEVKENTVDALMSGYTECLTNILREFETDLQDGVRKGP